MATRIRNDGWKDDTELEKRLRELYCKKNMTRKEVMNYVLRDFPMYAWSIPTLCRRMNFFNISKNDGNNLDEIKAAVAIEVKGPGQMLGYRAMHLKLKAIHGINVPRDAVYAAMTEVDPMGLAGRTPAFKKKPKKGHYSSVGPCWLYSLDGHDKLMGYQNSTFPLAIYGCMCVSTCACGNIFVFVPERIRL